MLKSDDHEMIKLGAALLREEKPQGKWQSILRECQKNAGNSIKRFEYIIRSKRGKSIIKVFPKNLYA